MTLLSVLLLAPACAQKPMPADSTSSILIEMKTGPCFGYCPVYDLVVHKSGLVDYEGKRFAQLIGKKQIKLKRKERLRLKKKVNAVNLHQYPDNVPTQIADAPFVTMTVYRDGKPKTVRGSIDRPQPLLDLEALIVQLVEKHGINLTKGVPPARDR
jgi:hypothetical protein